MSTASGSCGRGSRSQRPGGFSMIELLVVVAIVFALTAISLPTFNGMLTSAQLRGGMGDLSGLFQNARNLAVRQNTITWVRFQNSNNRLVYFVDNGASPTNLTTSTPQIYLPANFTKVGPPSGTPTALDDATCGAASSSTLVTDKDTYFNQMGIPCQYSGGTCSTATPFAYYFSYTGSSGGPSWAALCVSPAGRIKALYWTGSSWTN